MTLTRSQIHERLGGLSGEIKAAREQKRQTAQSLADAEHAITLARQADDKAQGHIERLEQEARDLTDQYAAAVNELIAEPETAGQAFDADVVKHGIDPWTEGKGAPFGSVFAEPADFQAQMLSHAADKVNGAYDEATR